MRYPTAQTCLLQNALRSGLSAASLCERYALTAKRHKHYPNLVQFRYSQRESDFTEPIVQEARGIILDEANNWRIIARPFDKFFNWDEPMAPMMGKQIRVLEKLDGSLMILYHYDRQWRVATTGTPDASGSVAGFDMTFEMLFWKTFKEMDFVEPSHMHTGYTFMFELTSPWNRIVVPYVESRLTLLAVRSNWGGQEIPNIHYSQYNPVKAFPLDTLEQIKEAFNIMDPMKQEGFVVMDSAGRRVKVKHPGYVALHHLKDNVSTPRTVLEIIMSGESDEFLSYFPEWTETFEKTQAAYDGLVMMLEQAYEELSVVPLGGKEERKQFALAATKYPCSGVLFGLRDGYIKTVSDGLRQMTSQKLVEILRLKEAA